MLAAEGLDWDALPEARLCKDEEVGARLNDGSGNYKVTLSGDADPDDAAGGAAHRSRLLLMEAADATLSRCEHDVIFTRRWDHLCKFVALIKGDRNNS
jgi:ribonuclease BN (tRNA processing enzyme)